MQLSRPNPVVLGGFNFRFEESCSYSSIVRWRPALLDIHNYRDPRWWALRVYLYINYIYFDQIINFIIFPTYPEPHPCRSCVGLCSWACPWIFVSPAPHFAHPPPTWRVSFPALSCESWPARHWWLAVPSPAPAGYSRWRSASADDGDDVSSSGNWSSPRVSPEFPPCWFAGSNAAPWPHPPPGRTPAMSGGPSRDWISPGWSFASGGSVASPWVPSSTNSGWMWRGAWDKRADPPFPGSELHAANWSAANSPMAPSWAVRGCWSQCSCHASSTSAHFHDSNWAWPRWALRWAWEWAWLLLFEGHGNCAPNLRWPSACDASANPWMCRSPPSGHRHPPADCPCDRITRSWAEQYYCSCERCSAPSSSGVVSSASNSANWPADHPPAPRPPPPPPPAEPHRLLQLLGTWRHISCGTLFNLDLKIRGCSIGFWSFWVFVSFHLLVVRCSLVWSAFICCCFFFIHGWSSASSWFFLVAALAFGQFIVYLNYVCIGDTR